MLVAVASGGLGLLVGRLTLDRASGDRDALPGVTEKTADADTSPKRWRAPGTSHQRPVVVPVQVPAAEEASKPGAPRVLEFLDLHQATAAKAYAPLGLEAVGTSMVPYLQGVLRTIDALHPEMIGELQLRLEAQMCEQSPSEAAMMMYAQMGIIHPGTSSAKGINCAVAQHPKEDVLLWSLLDSWRNGGHQKTPALIAVEQNATDERTRRRYLAPDEQLAYRKRAAASQTSAQGEPR